MAVNVGAVPTTQTLILYKVAAPLCYTLTPEHLICVMSSKKRATNHYKHLLRHTSDAVDLKHL